LVVDVLDFDQLEFDFLIGERIAWIVNERTGHDAVDDVDVDVADGV